MHLFFVNFAEKDFIVVYKHNEFKKQFVHKSEIFCLYKRS